MSEDELIPDHAARDADALRQRYRELVRDVLANATVEEAADMKLLRYDVDGNFDYDTYREIQTLANKMKLDNQWVPESHIEILSRYLNRHAPACTRRPEQAYIADGSRAPVQQPSTPGTSSCCPSVHMPSSSPSSPRSPT